MRVVTAREMAAIDRDTIAGGVPGPELMERAGREIVRALLDLFPELAPPAPIAICCGKGNNGGDGLVMARLLEGLGFEVSVLLLALPEDLSPDARINHDRLPPAVRVVVCPPEEWVERWTALSAEASLAVDAIFGTGVTPPVAEPYASLLGAFGASGKPVLAVDIPSGVSGDTGRVDPVAVRADATVTVGLPKLGLLLSPGREHVGRLAVVDIGFADEIVARHAPDRHHLAREDYAALLPHRPADTHKYLCGTLLVLAGSRAFGGAAVLTGLGALRSGAGLITVAVPECLETSARVALPEALIVPLPATAAGTLAPPPAPVLERLLERKHAVAVGPGCGDDPETDRWLADFVSRTNLPVVVDADGFSAFGRLGVAPAVGSAAAGVTPHAGELARVIGLKPAEVQKRRLDLAPELAARWGCVVLLKGSPTVIGSPDGAAVLNAAGHDALAHGGTGDVLTGLIGGLLAQGLGARDAAVLGAYLHGKAGESAAAYGSRRSVLAREVAEELGTAFGDLEWGPPRRGQAPGERP